MIGGGVSGGSNSSRVLDLVELAAVVDGVARPQRADHLDRLARASPGAPRGRGQRSPRMCSLSASPVPTPKKNRPSSSNEVVAVAWARIAGWIRVVGHVTPTPTSMRSVVAAMAPEHRPHERAVALRLDPRMEVVGDRHEVEPGLLGLPRPARRAPPGACSSLDSVYPNFIDAIADSCPKLWIANPAGDRRDRHPWQSRAGQPPRTAKVGGRMAVRRRRTAPPMSVACGHA